MNRGRRPVTIIEGAIELPNKEFIIGGKAIKPLDTRRPLFNYTSQAGLTIEPHKRQVLTFEPFDAMPLRDCEGNANAIFTDAIGGTYAANFWLPDALEIIKMDAAWKVLRKQQESDATNPAKHPQQGQNIA